jgi:hypothetical protein
MEERFKVEFLDEAVEFLEGLEKKAREKAKLRKPFRSKKSILT